MVGGLFLLDQIGDRSVMYEKYNQIQIGSQLSDLEGLIGISRAPLTYDHTNVPVLVEGEKFPVDGFTAYYPSHRYVLLVHYSPVTEKVTGKGMLRTSISTQWAERLSQGYWP